MRIVTIALMLAALGAVPGPAHGEPPLGLRAGYTDWDQVGQVHFGAHVKVGEIFPYVDFTPNVEIGFGDDLTLMTVNGDLAYNFTEFFEAPWGLYVGGSLSFHYLDPKGFDGDLDLGFNGFLGATRLLDNGHEVLFELRFGLLDSPDLKATLGYTFF